MYDIHQLSAELNDKVVDKVHPVFFVRICRHMGHMKLSLVDKVLRRHGVAVFFPEFIQRPLTHRKVIGAPVSEKISAGGIASPDPHKIIEKGGEPHHSGVRMLLAPFYHPFPQIFPNLRIAGINLHQMLLVPVIRSVIVHGNLFPDPVSQKAHRIFMPACRSSNRHGLL